MKTEKICLEGCIGRLVNVMLERCVPSESRRQEIQQKLDRLYAQTDFARTPSSQSRKILHTLSEELGSADLYQEVKDKSLALAWQLYERIQSKLAALPDPFSAIVHLVIGANAIDYGTNPYLTLEEAERLVLASFDEKLDPEAVRKLKQRLDRAENILYIMDNCGESVFDRFLLERYAEKITVAVRGYPVLNDVTRREIAASGLEAYRIVDTGDYAAGVCLECCSREFLDAYRTADLVVAKGMGNFESLEGMGFRDTAFLFRAKCPVVEKLLGVEHLSLQLIHQDADPCKKNAIPGV